MEEEEAQNNNNSSKKLESASSKAASPASHEDNSKSNTHNSDCTPAAPSNMPSLSQTVLEKLGVFENQLARARDDITLVLENQHQLKANQETMQNLLNLIVQKLS